MGGSLPSSAACVSASLARLRGRFCSGLRPRLSLGFDTLRIDGERFLAGGSRPRPASREPHSMSWASSFALISSAWSAILVAALFSASFSSRRIWPRRSRFSESRRAHSFSRHRIRSDCVELTRAISRFWRKNFRRTVGEEARQQPVCAAPQLHGQHGEHLRASRLSVDTGGSFSLAMAHGDVEAIVGGGWRGAARISHATPAGRSRARQVSMPFVEQMQ